MSTQRPPPNPPPPGLRDPRDPPPAGRPPWRSEELFGAAKELLILHDGEEYRLRITRNNKLILTK